MDNLIACYLSGQIPEAAWQEHLADAEFAAYWARWCADRR